MAKRTFRVLTLSFIDDRLRQPGDIVLFEERDAGANLERVDAGKAPEGKAGEMAAAAVEGTADKAGEA